MIPNHHGIGAMVRDWNQAVSASQDLTKTGKLVADEVKELLEACAGDDLAAIAKEACDVVWCAVDVLVAHGIDFHAAFTEVTRSNWTKVAPDGSVQRRDDGKILKGPHFEPARPDRLIGRSAAA